MPPWSMDPRGEATRHHPVWLFWIRVTAAYEPPAWVRIVGLS